MGAAKKHGPAAYPGIDVGKSGRGARALDAAGGVVFRADLDNGPDAIDRLPERAGDAAPVVVDQKRDIGALVPAGTRAKNRLRAVPLEADPEPERAADPSSPRQMAALSELGGAPGCSAAGRGAFADAARRAGAPAARARGLRGGRSTRRRGPGGAPARERTSRRACRRARYPRRAPTSPSSTGS